ncbi:hypothetical protein [Halovivax ruber]|uniref:hypothetical protein n=1 Tax=Halovivax ruber TaxID=387341 RepID=UPI0011E557D8|nr:hypothetical protein [Halovivax ruber]
MTRCFECSDRVNPRLATVYVPPDEGVGLTLCVGCQTAYPKARQYKPRRLPNQSRTPIKAGDLP